MSSYSSFCITVRPRDGLSNVTLDKLSKWLISQDYAVAVTEMADAAKHLHAQIWLNKPRSRGDVNKQLQRICESTIEDFDRAQLKVLRNGTKIAYSDWYLDYLVENDEKNEKTAPNIIINNPPAATTGYYPSEEEQAEAQARSSSVDPRFADLEIRYNHYSETHNLQKLTKTTVAQFLCYAMFQERVIRVIQQQRDRSALCTTLHAYLTKSANTELFIPKTASELKLDKKLEKLFEDYTPEPWTDDEDDNS